MKHTFLRVLTGIVIIGGILVIESKASSLNTQSDFKLQKQEIIHNDTDFRTIEILKNEQNKIKEILVKFEILEESLKGFEDKFVVNKIKEEFQNKYLITNSDLLLINDRINAQIKIKDNPEEGLELLDTRD